MEMKLRLGRLNWFSKKSNAKSETEKTEASSCNLVLHIGHATDRGKQRELNEDSYCAVNLVEQESQLDAILAVADGMGGHVKGEVASLYSIRQLLDLFVDNRYYSWTKNLGIDEDNLPVILKEAFHEINSKIYETSNEKTMYKGMGTTLTAALLRMPELYICHVGDSRAYLLHNEQFKQLTNDHSWVSEQINKGVLDEDDPKVQQFSNYITQAIGTAPTVKIELIEVQIHDGDLIFLCSDGLYELVDNDEIKEKLLSLEPQEACGKLVKLANKKGGYDNITCVAAKVEILDKNRAKKSTKIKTWKIVLMLFALLIGLGLGALYWIKPVLYEELFDFLSKFSLFSTVARI